MTLRFTPSTPQDEGFPDWGLLERYWFGETSPEETAIVEDWHARYPEQYAWCEQLRGTLVADRWIPLQLAEVNHTISKVLETTGATFDDARVIESDSSVSLSGQYVLRTSKPISEFPIERSSISRWLGYTFATCILSVVSLVVGLRWTTYQVDFETARRKSIYTTPNGQRANITLPDGSEVVLNAGSQLEVPANFALGVRVLQLTGEALFTVAHHSGTPLTVTTRSATARVLGTSFLVREYDTDSTAIVAVRDGRVAVDSIVLSAYQKVEVGRMGVARVLPVERGQFAFASGILDLHNVPLSEAVVELSRWYNIDIRIGDSALATQRITGQYRVGGEMDLINTLELTFKAQAVRDGRVFTLYTR